MWVLLLPAFRSIAVPDRLLSRFAFYLAELDRIRRPLAEHSSNSEFSELVMGASIKLPPRFCYAIRFFFYVNASRFGYDPPCDRVRCLACAKYSANDM